MKIKKLAKLTASGGPEGAFLGSDERKRPKTNYYIPWSSNLEYPLEIESSQKSGQLNFYHSSLSLECFRFQLRPICLYTYQHRANDLVKRKKNEEEPG